MRVYISADMEGTGGISSWPEVTPGSDLYPRSVERMVAEVNAAVEGALAGGADAVLVNDSHDGMRNLPLGRIHPAAELISGAPKPWSMVEGVDLCDLMFCTGYHAMAGSAGTLAHTYNLTVQEVRISGQSAGELALNARYAGLFGVPVGLCTGDSEFVREARALLPSCEVVAVKEAIGRYAVRSLPEAQGIEAIREAAEEAVRRRAEMLPLKVEQDPALEVRFLHAGQAGFAALLPGSERLSPLVVGFRHSDYREVLRAFRAMITLASGAKE